MKDNEVISSINLRTLEEDAFLLWPTQSNTPNQPQDEIVIKDGKEYRVKARVGTIKLLEPVIPLEPVLVRLLKSWKRITFKL